MKLVRRLLLTLGIMFSVLCFSNQSVKALTVNDRLYDFYIVTNEAMNHKNSVTEFEQYCVRCSIALDGTLTVSGSGTVPSDMKFFSPDFNNYATDKDTKKLKITDKFQTFPLSTLKEGWLCMGTNGLWLDGINYVVDKSTNYRQNIKVTKIVTSANTGDMITWNTNTFSQFLSDLTDCIQLDCSFIKNAPYCTSYYNIFTGCKNLQELDMSQLDVHTLSVANAYTMGECSSLVHIKTPSSTIGIPSRGGYFWVDETGKGYAGNSLVNGYHTLTATRIDKMIKYNLDGGKWGENTIPVTTYSAVYGLNSIQSPSERTGYIFLGWYYNDRQITSIPAYDAVDYTLTAKWQPVQYKINYHLNGGTNNVANKSIYTINDSVILYSPERTGYSFMGWYKDDTYKKKWETSYDEGKRHEDMDVYALWEIKTYSIKYELFDGTLHSSAPRSFTVNDKIKLVTPKKDMYTFLGWYTDIERTKNKVTEIPKGTTNSVTLYAKWELTTVHKAKNTTVSKVKASKKGKKLTVKWKAVKGYKYQVRVAKKNTMRGAKAYKVKTNKLTLKKVKGVRYIQVRTYKKIYGKTYYGKWSSIVDKR